MAVQTAQKFLERIAYDKTLQNHFRIAAPNNPAKVVRFAAGKGFIFSEDDLRAALKSFPQNDRHIIRELRKSLRGR
jgi:predicted ribosomally synthesized peptide with nif11-like leader